MTPTETINEKIFVLMHLMHPGRHAGNGGRSVDTSRGQGRVIALLKLKDGISTKQLAQVLGLRVSSLNETLVRLESAGLVERRPSDDDKRIMLVYLTDAGKKQELGVSAQPDPYEDFSEEDFATLEGLLDRMIANVEKTVGEGSSQRIAEEVRKRREMFDSMRSEGGRGGHPGHPGHGGHMGHGGHPGHGGHGRPGECCGRGGRGGHGAPGECEGHGGHEGHGGRAGHGGGQGSCVHEGHAGHGGRGKAADAPDAPGGESRA